MDTYNRLKTGLAGVLKGEISAWGILLLVSGIIRIVVEFI